MEESSTTRPPVSVTFSEHLPESVEAVYLPRLARLLINNQLWRRASSEERRSMVRRLAGSAGGAGEPAGYVWGWSVDGEPAELRRPLQDLSPAAWEAMLPTD